jgi:hypothetical protein
VVGKLVGPFYERGDHGINCARIRDGRKKLCVTSIGQTRLTCTDFRFSPLHLVTGVRNRPSRALRPTSPQTSAFWTSVEGPTTTLTKLFEGFVAY